MNFFVFEAHTSAVTDQIFEWECVAITATLYFAYRVTQSDSIHYRIVPGYRLKRDIEINECLLPTDAIFGN